MAFAALFDSLYCPEDHLDLYQEPGEEEQWPEQQRQRAAVLDDELPTLFEAYRGKEGVVLPPAGEGEGDGYGGPAGREAAVGWAARAVARLGFSALTAALATAYLDRCFLGGALRLGGQPWMARLAAVACVALAAKVEETHVPLLLDLQLCAAANANANPADGGEGDAYVFEAKTVRRMELLVLSALGWRMHPVTPFSYLQPLLANAAVRLDHCESVLLAVMADGRWPRHRPSAWAAAALLATAGACDDHSELLELINTPEDEIAECAKIISEATGMSFLAGDIGIVGGGNKRKHAAARMYSPPLSPSGVIGALSCFSSESSSSASADSRSPAAVAAWAASAPVSVSSSPEPPGRASKRAVATLALPLPPDEESRDAWPSTCAA
ncbi:cyclin-D3-2-like [Phragmites australis]|uniref:cyclin-D3-2-like n=1 Tax=Phragmites australis TaxID=29695 RepID=UPI002D765FD5|nr:cyclin-D3-2-like [Phragmites australis]